MKKKLKRSFPVILLIAIMAIILLIGYLIYRKPYREADKRNDYEDRMIQEYLKPELPEEPSDQEAQDLPNIDYQFSDVDSYAYHGSVDSILVIDKINLKKAIIRGNELSDNDYNLSKYYFVTADLTTTLDGNYIIYGHSSMTYGHSFNRLDELSVGDTFYILQDGIRYDYCVETVDRVLRSESAPYFPDLDKRVTLVSCEKYLAAGYSEKRVIIVRAVQTGSVSSN